MLGCGDAVAAKDAGRKDTAPCLTDEVHRARLIATPSLAQRLARGEESVQKTIEGLPASSLYVIPVAVHVIHDAATPVGTGENLSVAQIQSQIEAMNRDFRNTLVLPPPVVDTRIEFCLADITRVASPLTDHDWPAEESQLKALDYYPSDQYMNVWVVRSLTHNGNAVVGGYATLPGSGPPTFDGVVIQSNLFGSNSFGTFPDLLPGNDDGKIMTHEAGHYLYLFHTFQGGCVAPGDLVNDTPPIAANNFGCPVTPPRFLSLRRYPPGPDRELHGLHRRLLPEYVHDWPARSDARRDPQLSLHAGGPE